MVVSTPIIRKKKPVRKTLSLYDFLIWLKTITADDGLDGERPRFFHEHAAEAERVRIRPARGGVLVHVGADDVVAADMRGFLEPELGDHRKHGALPRDGIRKDDVEGGEAVGRDDEEHVLHFVHVAHLAAARQFQRREIGG